MASGAFTVDRDPADPGAIRFDLVAPDLASVPDRQLGLMDEICRVLDALRATFSVGSEQFERYQAELIVLARAGLEGDSAQPAVARRALELFREQLLSHEAVRLKTRYLTELGARALILGVPAAVSALLLRTHFQQGRLVAALLFVWAGCMAGAWLSFGARRLVLGLDDLHIPARDAVEPWVRLSFAGMFSVAVGLTFATRTILLAIGPMQTWRLVEHPEIAICIGLVCGFAEQLLSNRIAVRARRLLEPDALPAPTTGR